MPSLTERGELASLPGARTRLTLATAKEAQLAGGGGETEEDGRWVKCYPALALYSLRRGARTGLRHRPVHPPVALVLMERKGVYQTCGPCASLRTQITITPSGDGRLCSRCRRPHPWGFWNGGPLEAYLTPVFEAAWPDLDLLTTALVAQEVGEALEAAGLKLDPKGWAPPLDIDF